MFLILATQIFAFKDLYDYEAEDYPDEELKQRDPYGRGMGWDDYYQDYKEDDPTGPCADNATRVDGHCKCNEDTPNGNPYSRYEGCYACHGCSQYADCYYPGECNCQYTHKGNGTYCVRREPKIVAFSEIVHNVLNISIDYRGDDQLETAKCDINGVISDPVNYTIDWIQCLLPRYLPDRSNIAVIVNDKRSEEASYTIRSANPKADSSTWVSFLIFAAIMTFLIIGLKTSTPTKTSEMEPLIKKTPKKNENAPRRRVLV